MELTGRAPRGGRRHSTAASRPSQDAGRSAQHSLVDPRKPADPRGVAASLVDAVTEGRTHLPAALEAASLSALPAIDQGLARAIVRTTIRRRGDIDWALSAFLKKDLPRKATLVRAVLRSAAAQLLFMRQADHAAVNIAVELLKQDQATAGFRGLANAVLRRLAGEREALLAGLPIAANTPPWLYARWVHTYGCAAAEAMAAIHREEPPLDLAPSAQAPDGAIPLFTGGARLAASAVEGIEGFAAGGWWVQDVAAQLPVQLLGNLSGQVVLDLCAAPGGKTMQLAAAGATVTAIERDATRAARIKDNLARTGLADQVRVVVGDAREATGCFDAVLLDAPCSATGTLRRQPDVAWTKSERDIKTLAGVQQDLLRRAAQRVKPGGTLVYATCSLEREEGEAQLEFVAKALPELALDEVTSGVAQPFATAGGGIRTLPHMALPGGELRGLDGFFAARFRRR